jgi:hypothetical protein
MNLQDTIQEMKRVVQEIKNSIPADAVSFAGERYHDGIEAILNSAIDHIEANKGNQTDWLRKQRVDTLESDLSHYKIIAKRLAKK